MCSKLSGELENFTEDFQFSVLDNADQSKALTLLVTNNDPLS